VRDMSKTLVYWFSSAVKPEKFLQDAALLGATMGLRIIRTEDKNLIVELGEEEEKISIDWYQGKGYSHKDRLKMNLEDDKWYSIGFIKTKKWYHTKFVCMLKYIAKQCDSYSIYDEKNIYYCDEPDRKKGRAPDLDEWDSVRKKVRDKKDND